MGAQIALHCANAGIPTVLLDLTADQARQGLEKARKLKPDPQFTPDVHRLITTGGFDSHFDLIAKTDWIMEAVVERLDIKQQLLARVDEKRRPGSIVSSNTSGISIAALAEGRSDDFRRHWLGTHFFNPPRYLRLLEIIPTTETDPAVVAAITRLGDHLLGKGVVAAKDTPNFIGNHIALYGVARTLEVLIKGDYTIEEIDAITGPALGRPGSATFRTMDIAGIDVLAHVMRNLNERLPSEADRAAFAVPPLVEQLIARGSLGEKSGRGFYERRKNPSGETEIWTLDPASLEYRQKQAVRIASIEAAKPIDDLAERVRMLFNARDKAGAFLRATLAPTLVYTARVTPTIAHSIDDVDRVMRWGFGWEAGPFELFDIIGVKEVLAAAEAAGGHAMAGGVPPVVASVLEAGVERFREGLVRPAAADLQILRSAKEQQRVIKKNAGASLVDLGDGVLAVEFHSKMNAIGGDTIQMLQAGVKEASKNGQALVIGNDAPNFSAGANLMLVLLEAQEGNWEEIDMMIRAFQQANMALRQSPVPVIAAPAGLALGGGTEIPLHADRVQAAAETYMGLVEVGVGLIPAGGGTKEMTARAMALLPTPQSDPLPFVQKAFETVALAKVSASGPDAQRIGYLAPTDAFTMNRERLMSDAKAKALERVREGYHAPAPRTAIPVGGESLSAALKLGVHLAWRAGRASDHDALIGRKLAHIFGGGNVPHATMVCEQVLARSRTRSLHEPARRTEDARADSTHVENRQAVAKLMIDKGSGTPIVLIPGLQGRWEWMRPAVEALARHHRVITFSLCDERSSPFPCDPAKAFDNYLLQVDAAMDRAGIATAVVAGVSYGGLIAVEFAARRPERVTALVLASALHSSWQPDSRQQRYLNAPWLMSPMFVATAPMRMRLEMRTAIPGMVARLRFLAGHGARIALAPTSPARMARRIQWAVDHQFADPSRIHAPALVVTGERGLDRVVPVEVTEHYLRDLRSARQVVLKHTGHIGVVTRPDKFAEILGRFVDGDRIPA